MKIGIVDNYDSFTYNLAHYLEDITGVDPYICMNDAVNWDELETCTHIILSPGPGLPRESGHLMMVIERLYTRKNILGVCLGMQALAEFFGGSLQNLEDVKHGVQTPIRVKKIANNILYKDLPEQLEVGRYHSWVVNAAQLPIGFEVTAVDEEGHLMSFQHQHLPVYGVQYHPESIMTEMGKKILMNWLV
jgi:anthranilate synthase component 2